MNDSPAAPPSAKVLDAMVAARRSMNACMTMLDAAIYNPHDHTLTENRMDRAIVKAISALRHLHTLRHGQNSSVL
jgi:hypothetical protein